MNSNKIQILYTFIAGLLIIFILLLPSCTGSNGDLLKNPADTEDLMPEVREQIPPAAFNQDSKFICILQHVNYKMLTSIEFDVAIVDPDDSKLSKYNIDNLHSQNKSMIAYLSVGEAENYREYWQEDWKPGNPDFLDDENPNWKGNFKVKYWYGNWQKIVFESLSKIIDEGYDGVYLDLVDAYNYFNDRKYPDSRLHMINFVLAISKYVKNQKTGFLVVPQNSEELIVENEYLNAIDGVGRENLWFVGDNPQDKNELSVSLGYLNQITEAGKFVFVINYSQKEENIESFITLAKNYGFIPYVGPRELDRIEDAK